jgi:hypothetical protein
MSQEFKVPETESSSVALSNDFDDALDAAGLRE